LKVFCSQYYILKSCGVQQSGANTYTTCICIVSRIDGFMVDLVASVRNLGTYINANISMRTHVQRTMSQYFACRDWITAMACLLISCVTPVGNESVCADDFSTKSLQPHHLHTCQSVYRLHVLYKSACWRIKFSEGLDLAIWVNSFVCLTTGST